ncbi:hypothetical protein AVEN_107736-1 [Araneus ventricosus]|uniref:Uncharacterized protein n=1 Tax=Araneus ventricosus TaxID=182803 RepID=A0A4Y2IY11_ARAVE|nr:hypothetical protein AVEN_107736-1 [Araneus ventricosus]
MEKWLKTETLRRGAISIKYQTTDSAASEITVERTYGDHEKVKEDQSGAIDSGLSPKCLKFVLNVSDLLKASTSYND